MEVSLVSSAQAIQLLGNSAKDSVAADADAAADDDDAYRTAAAADDAARDAAAYRAAAGTSNGSELTYLKINVEKDRVRLQYLIDGLQDSTAFPHYATIYGPLWSLDADTDVTDESTRSSTTLARVLAALKQAAPRQLAGFAARAVQLMGYLHDFAPDSETAGLRTSAIWYAGQFAAEEPTGPPLFPVTEPPVLHDNRKDGPGAIESDLSRAGLMAALAAGRTAVMAQQERPVLPDAIRATEWVLQAAEAADRLVHELGKAPNGSSHKSAVSAAMEYEAASFAEYPGDEMSSRRGQPMPWFAERPSVVRDRLTRFRRKPAEQKDEGRSREETREDRVQVVLCKAENLIGTDAAVRTWLSIPNPDLGHKTPQQFIDSGRLDVLERLIDAGLEGDIG